MRAAVRDRFGSPDVLEIRDIEKPVPGEGEVLVRVRAASVNPADWHLLAGTPYVGRFEFGIRTPKTTRIGTDFSGTVEAVGANVTQLKVGDEVFGPKSGALADYICVREAMALPKPADVTFEAAAAVPIAAITALQGLRDHGHVQAGQAVLINGASGGVGTFAVQIAKSFGAEVTAVCSTANVGAARAMGADHVIDYRKEDFTRCGRRFELVIDIAGSRRWSELKRVLEPHATVVMIGAPDDNRLLGPLSHLLVARLSAIGSGRRFAFFIANFNRPDLELLGSMLEKGTLRPLIDRCYELEQVADAFRYSMAGHARGKVVVTL